MHASKNLNLLTEELLQKTIALRKKIMQYPKFLSTRKTYIEILSDIERVLTEQPHIFNRLRQLKIGIGRTVTDGDESTPIGQDLLLFHKEVHNYLKTVEMMNKE